MKALGWWLMLVGSLRLASVWFGFFNIWALRVSVFSKTTMSFFLGRLRQGAFSAAAMGFFVFFGSEACYAGSNIQDFRGDPIFCIDNCFRKLMLLINFCLVTEVHGRTFGVWTLLTCTLCYLCAFNLENRPLYLVTFLSFIYAFGHFLTEYLIYGTMAISNLTTVGIFAGTSIIWMLLQWNVHQNVHLKHS